jgi:sugar phosphate isomerase/epimerase
MKKYGYQALEPRVEWKHKQGIELGMSAAQRQGFKARFADENLLLSCVSTSVKMALPDEDERRKQIGDLHQYIDFAADIGAPYIRTFGGALKEKSEIQGVVNYTIKGYKETLEHARERQVVLLLETHDFWSHSDYVRAVVEGVDDSQLKVLWDIMHPQRMCETVQVTFANIGSLTRHLHAHDAQYVETGEKTQKAPLGKGDFDHQEPLRLLEEAGFDGCFSVEVIHPVGGEYNVEGVMGQYAEAFNMMYREIKK